MSTKGQISIKIHTIIKINCKKKQYNSPFNNDILTNEKSPQLC
uniref:Uncharacterized protein n=1 Tax=Rhizophora mucronata TaxID=61149 RepID=A0A2P2Q7Q6_RHIMU